MDRDATVSIMTSSQLTNTMSIDRTDSFSTVACPGGELCTCAPFSCRRSTTVLTAQSCRTLPHIPVSIGGIEPEPSSASLFLRSHRRPSRKVSSPGPQLRSSRSLRSLPRRASTRVPKTSSVSSMSSASSCWATDVLSVAHNALRFECAHLRTICISLRFRGHALVQDHEVDELASWWGVFTQFVESVLDAEQRIIVPWAIARGGGAPFLREEIDDMRVAALDAVAAVEATLDLRRHVDRSDVIAVFLTDAPTATARLAAYCTALTTALVPMIRANRAPAEKTALLRKVSTALRQGTDGGIKVALLTAWMQPEVRDTWVKRYLRSVNRLLYPRWSKRYCRHHVVVPVAFQRRLDAFVGTKMDTRKLMDLNSINSSPVTPQKTKPVISLSHLDAYASSISTSPVSPDHHGDEYKQVRRYLHL